MTWLSRLVLRQRVESQLDAELRDHFERLVEHHLRDGLSRAEARQLARLEFGGLDQVKELCRDARGTRWLEDFVQDVRYGCRGLRKSPGFAAVAVLTLALGVGANLAIFGVIDALLLRRLPVPAAHELIALQRRVGDESSDNFTYPQIRHLAEQADIFESLAAFGSDEVSVGPTLTAEPMAAAWVSGQYFQTLRVRPIVGRLLSADDDQPGAPPAVVITHRYWIQRFDRDPQRR